MPLTVHLAHTGRTLELECSARTTVDEVQLVVADLSGVSVADQILVCDGVPLAAGKPLHSYGLSESVFPADARPRSVFLYSRALLRPDAPLPPPETLPEAPPPGPAAAHTGADEEAHPLDEASSPLLRALPQYRRQFLRHLAAGRAAAAAGAAAAALAGRLVGEAEVQAMAVDAALGSVEPHYDFICAAQADFGARFARAHAHHHDVLSRFDADLEFLHSLDLPPALRAPRRARLADLLDVPALRALAAECARSHRRFAARVAGLDALHAALRVDVEALFMRAPSVDLEALTRRLEEAGGLAEEQRGAAQALAADAARAEAVLAAAAAGAEAGPPAALGDAVSMLEAMHEAHVAGVLPRSAACGAAVAAFARECCAAKNALGGDALRALRTVAAQQSKIREMREALAPFPAALDRQDADVARLLAVRRLPAAYRHCLAECARRAAFGEKYAAFASDLAERMGRFRHKEAAVRAKFRRHVEGLLPGEMLGAMGLDQPPPHCQVSVPGDERARLLPVGADDLRRLQPPPRPGSAAGEPPSSLSALTGHGSDGSEGAPEEAGGGGEGYAASALQMENTRLRAELAAQVALDCIRAAEMAGLAPPLPASPASPAASPRPGEPGALPPDAGAKFERALAAKDALIAGLRAEAGAARRQAAAYEARVRAVEAQLGLQRSHAASAASSSGGGAASLPPAPPPPPSEPAMQQQGSQLSSDLHSSGPAAGSSAHSAEAPLRESGGSSAAAAADAQPASAAAASAQEMEGTPSKEAKET